MKIINITQKGFITGITFLLLLFAWSPTSTKNNSTMKKSEVEYEKGTYGYDISFLKKHNIQPLELKDANTKACLMVIPELQGRVMTSSANGNQGISFGWINYKLFESKQVSNQFNPFGGEERIWLGPEGGPFSIYFEQDKQQVFENWVVPPVLDTETYDVVESNSTTVKFAKNAILKNASGFEFSLSIERTISLLSRDTISSLFNVVLPDSLNIVGYQTENKLSNMGQNAWMKESGLLSIWMLCMFNPSPTTTVFIPYRENGTGPIVNDDYFGKVPSERLVAENGTIYFKIDGNLRSKIGLPPSRATEICGSYDSEKKVLTILWCSIPQEPKAYVNSKWGEQENPYDGDAINSYNDGPVADGSIMGPFYEIETSSPAANLKPGESTTHIQRVIHINGEEAELDKIVRQLFDLSLDSISTKFN